MKIILNAVLTCNDFFFTLVVYNFLGMPLLNFHGGKLFQIISLHLQMTLKGASNTCA